jgi:hypothetical protein
MSILADIDAKRYEIRRMSQDEIRHFHHERLSDVQNSWMLALKKLSQILSRLFSVRRVFRLEITT